MKPSRNKGNQDCQNIPTVVKGPIPFFGKFFFHFLISLELCFLFFPFSF
jgi:hypothetical protein